MGGVYPNNNNNDTNNNNTERVTLINAETPSKTKGMVAMKDSVDIKLTVHESMYYYAPISFMFMVMLALFLEAHDFYTNHRVYTQIIMDHYYLFTIVSVLGYGVMISSFLVTKFFSGLYLKALSVCRNFILVLLVVYFGEIMTTFQVIGYTVSIIGFIYYNYVRLQQNN